MERLGTITLVVDLDDAGKLNVTQHREIGIKYATALATMNDAERANVEAALTNGATLVGKALRYIANPGGTGRIITSRGG